ncbi:MAG: YmdB family metallophosphoesterase [Spirochaetia bacterium]
MENSVRILFLGEIVGKAGVYCVKNLLSTIKEDKNIDFVIADGEGATGGFGIGKNHSIYLHKLGIDVITSGECIYYKKDMVPHIRNAPYILRPANYPPGNPGRGWWTYSVKGVNIGVINLLGQSGFNRTHLSNPYTFLPEIVSRMRDDADIIILDFHAATTAEKYTMFYHADGLVTAVIGTHFKTPTADERIMPKGTAVVCDVGRTGSIDSVGGLLPDIEIQKQLTQVPERSKDAWGRLEMQGVIIQTGREGKNTSIERIRIPCEGAPNEGNG